jgi:hypothetical protein
LNNKSAATTPRAMAPMRIRVLRELTYVLFSMGPGLAHSPPAPGEPAIILANSPPRDGDGLITPYLFGRLGLEA